MDEGVEVIKGTGFGGKRWQEALNRKPSDGQKPITMAAISKASGVSQGAVSSLLNGREYGIRVRKETRDRVFNVCREMGYIPNDLRAVMRMYPEAGQLCVLRPQTNADLPLHRGFISHLTNAVDEATQNFDGGVSLASYSPTLDYSKESEAIPPAVHSGISTKFVLIGEMNSSLASILLEKSPAVVSLFSKQTHKRVANFRPDLGEASALAIRQLYSLGHRRIAVLTGPGGGTHHPLLTEMNTGVITVCRELGLTPSMFPSDLTFSSGAQFLDAIKKAPERPTAVFCIGSNAAAGLISRAWEVGFRIPEDLSVINCPHDVSPNMLVPHLTSIQLPILKSARLAVETAESIISNPDQPVSMPELLPASLVAGMSCGAPSGP